MFDSIILRLIHYVLALGTFLKLWIFRVPALSYKKSVPRTVQSDARTFKKLPIHIGLLVLENDISYSDIANTLLWSAAMGVSYISVYDTDGIVKRNKSTLYDAVLQNQKHTTDSECSKKELKIHSGMNMQNSKCSQSSHVDIYLLSLEDGRQSLVQATQTICRQVSKKQFRTSDLTPDTIDSLLQDQRGCPDPDLIIKFGQVDSLLGFSPWQIRLSEILSLPSHIGLDYKTFKSVFVKYGASQQRFGK